MVQGMSSTISFRLSPPTPKHLHSKLPTIMTEWLPNIDKEEGTLDYFGPIASGSGGSGIIGDTPPLRNAYPTSPSLLKRPEHSDSVNLVRKTVLAAVALVSLLCLNKHFLAEVPTPAFFIACQTVLATLLLFVLQQKDGLEIKQALGSYPKAITCDIVLLVTTYVTLYYSDLAAYPIARAFDLVLFVWALHSSPQGGQLGVKTTLILQFLVIAEVVSGSTLRISGSVNNNSAWVATVSGAIASMSATYRWVLLDPTEYPVRHSTSILALGIAGVIMLVVSTVRGELSALKGAFEESQSGPMILGILLGSPLQAWLMTSYSKSMHPQNGVSFTSSVAVQTMVSACLLPVVGTTILGDSINRSQAGSILILLGVANYIRSSLLTTSTAAHSELTSPSWSMQRILSKIYFPVSLWLPFIVIPMTLWNTGEGSSYSSMSEYLSTYSNSLGGGRYISSTPRLCNLDELTAGNWVKKDYVPFTVDGLLAVHQERPFVAEPMGVDWASHRPDGAHCQVSQEASDEPAHQARMLDVNAWKWKQEQTSCQVIDWDYFGFVRRLLSSHAGMILIGDSLTEQMWDSLALRIGNQGPFYQEARVRELYLDTWHSEAQEILQGLPFVRGHQSRNITILTFIRNDMGIDRAGFEAVTEELGLPQVKAHEKKILEDWHTQVSKMLDPPDGDGRNGEVVREEVARLYDASLPVEKSIVILNFGAHWNSRWLGFVEADAQEHRKEWIPVYQGVIDATANYIQPINDQVLFFYRATNIPHDNCKTSFLPNNTLEWHQPEDAPLGNGWELFPLYNEMWKKSMKGPKFGKNSFYLDIERLTATRPDAHRWPFLNDCLHFCVPSGPVDAWGEFVWHQIVASESQRKGK